MRWNLNASAGVNWYAGALPVCCQQLWSRCAAAITTGAGDGNRPDRHITRNTKIGANFAFAICRAWVRCALTHKMQLNVGVVAQRRCRDHEVALSNTCAESVLVSAARTPSARILGTDARQMLGLRRLTLAGLHRATPAGFPGSNFVACARSSRSEGGLPLVRRPSTLLCEEPYRPWVAVQQLSY